MRTPSTPTSRGPSVYQTSHEHLCAVLRGVLVETVQSGCRAAGGIGTAPCRAIAALYMILMNHPVDRRGRCRSCRRPGALLGLRRRRCWVHAEATVWLHQPTEFLRTQLAHELGLTAPPATLTHPNTPAVPVPPLPPGVSRAGRPDPDHGGAGEPSPRPRFRRDPPPASPDQGRALLLGGV